MPYYPTVFVVVFPPLSSTIISEYYSFVHGQMRFSCFVYQEVVLATGQCALLLESRTFFPA